MVQLLPPVGARCHSELGAEPLVGPGIVGVLVPRTGLVPRGGDLELHKQTPRRIVNVEAIQTAEEGVCGLEMVISRDPAASSGAPEGEIVLALPPGHRSVLPVVPRLVCHSNVPGKRRVVIISGDVWEDGLEVTSLVINHCLLVSPEKAASL